MGAFLSHLASENTVSDLVVKYLLLLNVTDIMAGKFHSERNGPVHFTNSTIFDNTDIVISTNRVGGNHWTFIAIEIKKNACFVYMDPKGYLYTDLPACHKYCQMCKCSRLSLTGNMVVTHGYPHRTHRQYFPMQGNLSVTTKTVEYTH